MATVYEVVHLETGERQALKLMNPGVEGSEALARFEREFRLLSKLCHPNIAAVYEAGLFQDRPWYRMELVRGVDLRKVVEGWELRPPPPAERFALARSVLQQTAAALEYIHLYGLVHRDLTPGNLMILPDGSLKLMDFGVVKEAGGELTSHGEFLGTVAYVSPEQIQGQRVDRRADLYSLGAVLYFLLTGRKPFVARTLAGFLEKQLHQSPRPPSELVDELPPLLEDVCLRLLQKDPAKRFPTATHLLAMLEPPGPLGPQPLVGRDLEVLVLSERVIRCAGGSGGVVLVTGANGMGKSRMAKVAVDVAKRCDIFAIRTHAAASDLPLGAFDRLFDALAAGGMSGPRQLAEALRGGKVDRHVVYSTYRNLLIGQRGNPRLLLLDDFQLLDPSSWDLLQYLIRNTVTLAEQAVLWVVTADPTVEEEKIQRFKELFRPVQIILDPLSVEAVEELLCSLVGDSPAARVLAHRIHQESEGNQGFIQEMLRGLLEEEVLVARDGRLELTLEESQLQRSALPVPSSIRAAIEARIRHLSPSARMVAEVLAVGVLELTPELLSDVLGRSEADVQADLSALEAQALVRGRVGEPRYGLAQSSLRELLLEQLTEAQQAAVHQRIGQVLERRERHNLERVLEPLAWHFEQGQLHGKGYAYLVRAGHHRLESAFMIDAADYFTRALALEPSARGQLPLDEADRRLAGLLLSRARALQHLGRFDETLDDLTRARSLAEELRDEGLRAEAAGELGQQARQLGRLEEARSYAQEALRATEGAQRSTPLQVLAGVAWAQGDLDEARRYWQELLTVGEASKDPRATAFGYNGLGLAALCKGQTAEARRSFEQSAMIFEQEGLVAPLATARGNLVEIHHFTGNLKRGLELAERTRSESRENHHPPGVARSLCYKALILCDMEHTDESLAVAEEGLAMLCELGDPSEELFGRVVLTRAAWAAGELERVADELDACDELLPRHDSEGFTPMILAWRARYVAATDPERAQKLLLQAQEVPGIRWPYQECRLDLALSRGYAALGDRAEASRRAESAVRRADACGFRLYALKGHCLATLGGDEVSRARHRRIADGLARSLAASLGREDSERFLAAPWLHPAAE